MLARFVRAFRTSSSERFIVQSKDGEDSAVLELHYLPSGSVAGTVIIFDQSKISDANVADLLQTIDEVLLPEVSIEHHKVSFTVVRGHVIGDFAPTKPA
jgi:hypothetical protein